jgi:hypothetical protein
MERMPAELVLEVLQHARAIVPQSVLDALCERIAREGSPLLRRSPVEPPTARHELDDLLHGAVGVHAALVLVCRPWYKLFAPFLYYIFYARSPHAAQVILKALEMNPDLRTQIRQIIAIPAGPRSWTPQFSDTIDNLVSLCPNVVRLTLLQRDDFLYESGPLASRPLIERTHHEWNHLRHLTVSSLTWDSFVSYVVAVAESSKLENLHIYGVGSQGIDISKARGFLPRRRDLFSLRELTISNADSQCLDLLRSYRFSHLRSFTFHGDIEDLTEPALAAFLGPVFYTLEYLSLPYSALRNERVVLPMDSTRLLHV